MAANGWWAAWVACAVAVGACAPVGGGQCSEVVCDLACGRMSDGCGGFVECGGCPDGLVCGAGSVPNRCAVENCQPASCAGTYHGSNRKTCGTLSDGCGGTLDCGGCPQGQECGAAGEANACGTPVTFGGPGPWPLTNRKYSTADGLLELPVVGVSTDETQNLWVATPQALYLLQPSESRFRRFTEAQGLHLPGNTVAYCHASIGSYLPDTPENQAYNACVTAARQCPQHGAAAAPGITALVGGGRNEVFVGYAGVDSGSGDWCDPNRHSGKMDRVRLKPDGSLQVDRFDFVSGGHGSKYWHNRSVLRLVYDHFVHKHELYVGSNHGVILVRPDAYRPANKGEWFNKVNLEYMADHLHPRVCVGGPCSSNVGESASGQRMGDWYGLALAPDGDVWVAGKWTAGKIRWTESLETWISRPGSSAFAMSFGDSGQPNDPPVFPVPNVGDPVGLSAVAVATDGTVYFASDPRSTGHTAYGLAVYSGGRFTYPDLAALGIADKRVRDLAAWPDGRLILATPADGLVVWNPSTGDKTAIRASGGLIPSDRIRRLEVDRMVEPPALHVATDGGAAVLRQLP